MISQNFGDLTFCKADFVLTFHAVSLSNWALHWLTAQFVTLSQVHSLSTEIGFLLELQVFWRTRVKYTHALLTLLILAAASTLAAQSPTPPTATTPAPQAANPPATAKPAAKPTAAQIAQKQAEAKKADKNARKSEVRLKPFSSIAFGGGMSLMGINMQASTNLDRYLNLRGTGNFFNYTDNNISTNGFNLTGKINMATAGVSVDVFPFPSHGLRVSPGMLFYNQNNISGTASPQPGKSFTLNGVDYYPQANSSTPFQVNANLGLNTHQQAFTLTTGWGNVIPRRHPDQLFSHLTFPFEIGAAFTGVPTINMNLSGFACDKNGLNCVNMATDPTAQANLNAQLAKWRSDLNPLKVYPIFSIGVSYSFNVGTQQ
jgi:hypothetical protein